MFLCSNCESIASGIGKKKKTALEMCLLQDEDIWQVTDRVMQVRFYSKGCL